MDEEQPHYGLIGQMIAQPGQRAALAAILTEDTDAMPGNFAYLVGEDSANPDALWIVELWADKDAIAVGAGGDRERATADCGIWRSRRVQADCIPSALSDGERGDAKRLADFVRGDIQFPLGRGLSC